MNKYSRLIVYTLGGTLFISSFIGMIVYGYKTFYIEEEVGSSDNYRYHFALVAEEIDNEYWRLIEKGARKIAAEHDIYLEYVGPLKADNDQLLKLLDRMVSVKVDGIITQGVEGQRFVDLVLKGVERGIPIVTVDTDVKSSVRKVYVGTDNFYAGQLAGETVIANTTGEQYVGIVTGRFDAINQQERLEGFKDAIQETERIQIVGIRESNITQVGAAQATYSLLKEYPAINVLVGLSALDGIGMVEGLREIAPNKDVYLTAFDILPETLNLIQREKIDATIAQYPEKMGQVAIEAMINLQQSDLLESEIFTQTIVVEKENSDAFLQGERR
ncbi:substrate-binding domain-containing protein [Sporosarcina sp. YIM B06819]|uniref:substrate-binding domain-containing protein n=1 Tax=Sporosarcina sp. YIM B06819 TaxID=3081769 RepID=UPI00298CEB11|nr:substrate-binding domain-containing protein [Sporosarcina sp. YIM B06819]